MVVLDDAMTAQKVYDRLTAIVIVNHKAKWEIK
jgi:hypothetical protein